MSMMEPLENRQLLSAGVFDVTGSYQGQLVADGRRRAVFMRITGETSDGTFVGVLRIGRSGSSSLEGGLNGRGFTGGFSKTDGNGGTFSGGVARRGSRLSGNIAITTNNRQVTGVFSVSRSARGRGIGSISSGKLANNSGNQIAVTNPVFGMTPITNPVLGGTTQGVFGATTPSVFGSTTGTSLFDLTSPTANQFGTLGNEFSTPATAATGGNLTSPIGPTALLSSPIL